MRHEPEQLRGHRAELTTGLRGTVLEVGAGSGAMFPCYPPSVTQVVAVEPEPYLRARAAQAAPGAPVPVAVVAGAAEHLPAGDDTVDAVVFSLVLCSVRDQDRALAEARRVLRRTGRLRYYEHVGEPAGSGRRRYQQAVDRSGLWSLLGGGCQVARDTGDAVRRAGFDVEWERDLPVGPPPVPARRHILGSAR